MHYSLRASAWPGFGRVHFRGGISRSVCLRTRLEWSRAGSHDCARTRWSEPRRFPNVSATKQTPFVNTKRLTNAVYKYGTVYKRSEYKTVYGCMQIWNGLHTLLANMKWFTYASCKYEMVYIRFLQIWNGYHPNLLTTVDVGIKLKYSCWK